MRKKPTMKQFLWPLLFAMMSLASVGATDCSWIAKANRTEGAILSPLQTNTTSYLWNIEMPDSDFNIALNFHNYTLRNCSNCTCESIEIWSSQRKDPKSWIGKYCGDLSRVRVESVGRHMLIEIQSTSWPATNRSLLTYSGAPICVIYDNYDNYDSDTGSSVLNVWGIFISLGVFLVALLCGTYIFKKIRQRPKRRRRREEERPSVITELPKMPTLPNYFDTDNNMAELPSYLGHTSMHDPTALDAPPPYSPQDYPPPYSTGEAETENVVENRDLGDSDRLPSR